MPRAAAGRQVDDLRVVVERLLELHDEVGLEDAAAADAADGEALDEDLRLRCHAPHDTGDERAVAGVRAQVGAVELVVAVDVRAATACGGRSRRAGASRCRRPRR